MIKVCHLSSAHPTYDTRILLKECVSLAKNGYDVSLIIPGEKKEIYEGVQIIPVKKSNKRLSRMTFVVFSVFFKALKIKAKIYHFHDPELFFVGLTLKLFGKKVVFDVHENISKQIKSKNWLPFRNIIAFCYTGIDFISAKLFYLILAENSYSEIYKKYTSKYEIVLNLPDIDYLDNYIVSNRDFDTNEFFYVGGITFERGIEVIINALSELKDRDFDFFFHCIGPFEEKVKEQIENLKNYNNVKNNICFYGSLKLEDAFQIAKKCKVGMSILQNIENYKYSYSTKIFEYMAVQLPVITSNFQLYKDVIEKYNAGFCIDPTSSLELADKLIEICSNRELIKTFGKNGRELVLSTFNWKNEEKKLLTFYQKMAKDA
jgi:glycosyltransferase involved in cell wall biosynthesis